MQLLIYRPQAPAGAPRLRASVSISNRSRGLFLVAYEFGETEESMASRAVVENNTAESAPFNGAECMDPADETVERITRSSSVE